MKSEVRIKRSSVYFQAPVFTKLVVTAMGSTRDKAKQSWQSAERAAAYRVSRDPSRFTRYDREEKIVKGWLADLPVQALVLDIPCGTGRLIPLLTSKGFRYTGADFSRAMIHEAIKMAGEKPTVGFVNADVEFLPYRDKSVDCVMIWRLLHHIGNTATRQAILREAARVSRQKVLVSFHHPISFTHWRKLLQQAVLGGEPRGHAVSHWQLQKEGEIAGLRLIETKGFRKYVSVNWFACFEKSDSAH